MRKKITTIVIIAVAALILGGAYIWYSRTYGNAGAITLNTRTISFEWKDTASDYNITGDYLWSRIKELMLEQGDDGILIPSTYMIEGRLTSEPKEESGIYLLSDQALLMKAYVRDSDRFSAVTLKNEVISRLDVENQSISEQMAWLEGYVAYYSAYGTSEDYKNINDMISRLFDENGMVVSSTLSAASYQDSGFVSTTELDENGLGNSTLESPAGTEETELYSFEGVELSSVRLNLIRSLEENDLLPEGSFDRNLQLVLDAKAADDIPLYAYAYTTLEDGTVSYIYFKDTAAAINVVDSIRTMRNLAEVDSLPQDSFNWVKNNMMNLGTLYDEYYLVTGQTDGEEAVDSYVDIMYIGFYCDDTDLYANACSRIGSRVATYASSPALSMVYRSLDDRYYFVARENLEVCLAVR
ncbi:MAG: hypothetical protein IKT14_06710 [Clostridiales bacterium]|nr:hypothetical protein [Clostridiales bacterium]